MIPDDYVTFAERYPNWIHARCSLCGGHGQRSSYTWDGSDFLGPEECPRCGGSGDVWVSSKDRLAQYPGGPLMGSAPGLYAETRDKSP